MKKLLYILLLLPALLFAGTNPSATKDQVNQWMQAQPVRFLENKGQMIDMAGKPVPFVLFKAEAPGMNLYITEKGITYVFTKSEEERDKKEKEEKIATEWERIDMDLKGATIKKENIIKKGASSDYSQYFLAHCPKGITDIHSYQEITIKDVYPNIDWLLYNAQGTGFKYDFIVHPGADPKQIELVYSSLHKLKLNRNGELEIKTKRGFLREKAPYSFLKESNEKVESQYLIKSQIKSEDHYQTNVVISLPSFQGAFLQTLVIDPQLVWGTYYGGNDHDGFCSLKTDVNGNIFVTGYSVSSNFPTFDAGGNSYYNGVYGGFDASAVLLKFSNSGTLLMSTYYGASTYGVSIVIDGSGNIFVIGFIKDYLPNFPTLNPGSGAYFQASGGGDQDAFLLKFSNSGLLLWATYYGGNGEDQPCSVTMDNNGNLFVVGTTKSTNLSTINPGGGAYFNDLYAGFSDAFLLKFSSAGALLWATYYGGSVLDYFNSVTIDVNGNVFVTGTTESHNISMLNPGGGAYFQATSGWNSDAFILKFSNNGILLWSTYYGGNGVDAGVSITTDGLGNVFVIGHTTSINFPLLNPLGGSYFQTSNAGGYDLFLLKFSNMGALLWATYYGGSGDDSFLETSIHRDHKIVIDANGNIFVIGGKTLSLNFPTLNPGAGAYFQGVNAGGGDIFLLEFSNNGIPLWSTYNGTNADYEFGAAIDTTRGCLIAVGEWTGNGSNGLLNPGSNAYYSGTWSGGDDSYIMKFCPTVLSTTINPTTVLCSGDCSGTAMASPFGGTDPYTYSWDTTPVQTTQTATGLCPGNYTLTVTDAANSSISQTVTITQPQAMVASISSSTDLSCNAACDGNALVSVSGGTPGYAYLWNTASTQTTANVSGLCAGSYSCTITDTHLCTTTVAVIITQPDVLIASVSAIPVSCGNNDGTATITASGGTAPYIYHWTGGGATASINNLNPGTYTVTVTDAMGCTETNTAIIGGLIMNAGEDITILAGTSTILNGSGSIGSSFNWSPSSGLSCSNCATPVATPDQTTTYILTVTLNGCSISDTITVFVDLCTGKDFPVPNAFSPNNDGHNDLFILKGWENCVTKFTMIIFNRWGEEVFESIDPQKGWNGIFNGSPINSDVFVYYVKATLVNGEKINRKGNISLIR